MKLLFTFAISALSAKTDDRAYSNYPPFLTDGSLRQYWKANDGNIAKYNRLGDATDTFYDTFYSGNSKAARFSGHMRRLLKDTREDFIRQVARCDKRSKRGNSKSPVGNNISDGWTLPTNKGIKKSYEALFRNYANWAREEIYWDCPLIGMRVVSSFFSDLTLTLTNRHFWSSRKFRQTIEI